MRQFETSKLKPVVVGIVLLLLVGLLFDALDGFPVLKHSRSMYGMVIGLTLTAIFAGLGEYLSHYIDARDKGSHPLPRRAFHLLLLLASLAVVGLSYWFTFRYFGILKI